MGNNDDELLAGVFGAMTHQERTLSLAIDACHDALWHLQGERGVWVVVRRWWIERKLRRLEGRAGL